MSGEESEVRGEGRQLISSPRWLLRRRLRGEAERGAERQRRRGESLVSCATLRERSGASAAAYCHAAYCFSLAAAIA